MEMTYAGMRCGPEAAVRAAATRRPETDAEQLRAQIRKWEKRRQRAEDILEELRWRLAMAEER